MKKTLLIAILIGQLVIASFSWAATWYAGADCAAGNMSTCSWKDTDDGDCANTGSSLTWNNQATDDIFEANLCVGIIVNVDPKGTGAATKVHLKNTQGGNFTTVTQEDTDDIVITADGTAVGAALLTITGSAGGAGETVLTIAGGTTWTGGDGANEVAISDSHTNGTVIFGSAGNVVNVTAGSNSSAYGYTTTTVSPASGYVAATGVSAIGWSNAGAVAHTFLAGSSCTGSNATPNAHGCLAGNSSTNCYISITGGNIVPGIRAVGAAGAIRFLPTAPADGVTGNYAAYCQDAAGNTCNTKVYMGTNTDDATKALATFYYIDPTDGESDVGTYSASGGGAWAF